MKESRVYGSLEPVEGFEWLTYDEAVEIAQKEYGGDFIRMGKLYKPETPVAIQPTYMTDSAVGADCFAAESIIIPPKSFGIVRTGVCALFDDNKGLFPFIRSSIPRKKGLFLANGVGVVEADYCNNPETGGDIMFTFYNTTDKDVPIHRFERLGQFVLLPILRFENAGWAGMKRGGSGSTGS